jgi:hypothetical protein
MGGFRRVGSSTVRGTNGNELALLEYKGSVEGASTGQLHFLATIAVSDGQAVVATLTTKESSFDELRQEVEPYLLTLQAK